MKLTFQIQEKCIHFMTLKISLDPGGKKYWLLLKADPDLKVAITDFPGITYKRWKNLHDLLVHSHSASQVQDL